MKQKWFALVVAVLFSAASQAAIVQIKNMRDVAEGVSPGTLVVFDIDNTILQSKQTLGSVQWADWYEGTLRAQGLSKEEAGLLTSREWVNINRVGGQETVEAVTPNIIGNLQGRGVKVLALTARPTSFALQTLRDMPRFGVNFGKSWGPKTVFKSPFEGAAYSSGILFAGQTNSKGAVIREFLRQNNFRPKAIRFVDDKQKYVDSVSEAMAAAGIPYLGFRYGGADYRVNHMSKPLAAFVTAYWKRNHIILSDAQARTMMKGFAMAN